MLFATLSKLVRRPRQDLIRVGPVNCPPPSTRLLRQDAFPRSARGTNSTTEQEFARRGADGRRRRTPGRGVAAIWRGRFRETLFGSRVVDRPELGSRRRAGWAGGFFVFLEIALRRL